MDGNECVHFRTELFNLKCQSDLLTRIAMKFDEETLVRTSCLLAEYNCVGMFVMLNELPITVFIRCQKVKQSH